MIRTAYPDDGGVHEKLRFGWYLLYTKPHREDMVSESLRRIHMEVYNPKLLHKQRFKGAFKEKVVPLFPCYIFVKFEECVPSRLIQYTRGVRRIVSVGENPCGVSEDVIEAIKSREKEGVVDADSSFCEGDAVIVKDGPLKDFMGVFYKELSDHERVIILLNTVTSQRVVLDRYFVEKI